MFRPDYFILLFVAFFLCLPRVGYAVSSRFVPEYISPIEQRWRWSKIDRLSDYSISDIAQSVDGTLWFAHGKGVLRYDGFEWKDFGYEQGLQKNKIKQVFVSQTGDVYALSIHSLFHFKGDGWRRVKLKAHLGIRGFTQHIVDDAEGNLWILSDVGLLQVRGETGTWHFKNQSFDAMQLDKNDRLWLVTAVTGEIHAFDVSQAASTEPVSPHLIIPFWDAQLTPEPKVKFLLALDGDCLWVSSFRKKNQAKCLNTTTKTWDLAGDTLAVRHYGLIKTENEALYAYGRYKMHRLTDNGWDAVPLDQLSIPGKNFNIVQTQHDQALWLFSPFHDTWRIDFGRDRWRPFIKDLHFHATDLLKNRWFISANGAVIQHTPGSDTWVKHTTDSGVIDKANAINVSKNGTVWVSGQHQGVAAIAWFDGAVWQRQLFPKASNIVYRSFWESAVGDIVFSAYSQVSMARHTGFMVVMHRELHKEKGHVYRGMAKKLAPEVYLPLSYTQTQDGKIWLLAGQALYTTESLQPETVETTPVILPEAFPSQRNAQIVSRGNAVWIANGHAGVARLDDQGWQVFTAKDGLLNNYVYQFFTLDDHELGVLNRRGLSRWVEGEWFPWNNPVFSEFVDVLMIREASQDGYWVNFSARHWLSGFKSGGRQRIQTSYYAFDKTPPKVLNLELSDVEGRQNKQVSWQAADRWADLYPSSVQYATRIDEQKWSEYTDRQSLSLDEIPRGKHTLSIRARDIDLNVERSPAQISIRRPYFSSLGGTFFGVVFALMLALAVGLAYWFRSFIDWRSHRTREVHQDAMASQDTTPMPSDTLSEGSDTGGVSTAAVAHVFDEYQGSKGGREQSAVNETFVFDTDLSAVNGVKLPIPSRSSPDSEADQGDAKVHSSDSDDEALWSSFENVPLPNRLVSDYDTLRSADQIFLSQCIDLIEQHLGDADFTIEQFSEVMGVKYKTLYARLKGLTGLSLQMFIRSIRLEHSMALLQEGEHSIADVAENVGFSDRSYFSRCFKQRFHQSPSDISILLQCRASGLATRKAEKA